MGHSCRHGVHQVGYGFEGFEVGEGAWSQRDDEEKGVNCEVINC